MSKFWGPGHSAIWLRKYLAARKDDFPYLFVSGRGRLLPVTSRNYIRVHLWNEDSRQRIYHHLFRKSFATSLVRRGMDIKRIQKACRHKSSRTTLDFYTGVDDEGFKQQYHDIMENVFDGLPPKGLDQSVVPVTEPVTLNDYLKKAAQ